MEKIVIIGSPGAGKSTLARKLGRKLHIKVVHLDRIFWQPGWKEKPRDKRIEILEKLIQEKQWIIEGTYLSSSEPRLRAADLIIFLDVAPLVCLQRIINRHREYRGLSRHDIPQGSGDKLTLVRMWKVLIFPFQDRRTLLKKLRRSQSKQIIRLRSPKEVDDFLSRLEPQSEKEKQVSKKPSDANSRQLATVRR